MINIYIVLAILFIHWIADFVCQTDWQAQNKSKNWKALISHTFTYNVMWVITSYFLMLIYLFITKNTVTISNNLFYYFIPITFVAHTITDYFTSRLNSKLWNEKKVHWFFVSIGFDQFLHFTQLLLTYYILTQ